MDIELLDNKPLPPLFPMPRLYFPRDIAKYRGVAFFIGYVSGALSLIIIMYLTGVIK